MNEPRPLSESVDEALAVLLGPNVESYLQELQRHDAELRAIPSRHVARLQVILHRAMAEVSVPEESGFVVHAQVEELRGSEDDEIRQAMAAEHARHRKAVEELRKRI